MQLFEMASKTVDKAVKKGASQAEVSVFVTDSALTRFTKNAIHQNVAQRKHILNLDVVVGKDKRGSTALNALDDANIDESLDRVLKIAEVSTVTRAMRRDVPDEPVILKSARLAE